MKYLGMMIVMAVAMVALASGCSAKHRVETGKLTKGFASASAELKAQAESAVKAIKADNFTEAVAILAAMTDKGQLAAEQKQAIIDTLVDVQVIVSEKPPADAEALLQKIQDLQMKLM